MGFVRTRTLKGTSVGLNGARRVRPLARDGEPRALWSSTCELSDYAEVYSITGMMLLARGDGIELTRSVKSRSEWSMLVPEYLSRSSIAFAKARHSLAIPLPQTRAVVASGDPFRA